MNNKKYFVAFINKDTETSFEDLQNKQSQEKELHYLIEKIIFELKKDMKPKDVKIRSPAKGKLNFFI